MLLSETELRAALEPLLDRLLAERLRLFQLQFEPRVQAQIAAALAPQSTLELQDGLKLIAHGRTAPEVFGAVFKASQALVGAQRALVVVRGEQAVVWKAEGFSIPERFPARQREQILPGATTSAVRVRGKVVGYLCWHGAALPAPMAARLELLLQFAGLVMLEAALPAARAVETVHPVVDAKVKTERAQATTEAGLFAELLIEDLWLFLQRERTEDLERGVSGGDWRERFASEIERCRQAFTARYAESENAAIFEGVVPRLGERLGS